ncbi:MAG: hypothetical protein IKM21_00605 [Oscillospiraceae bacterium]|nr:hypothetical protein [Oscillospiraceae bacterium]
MYNFKNKNLFSDDILKTNKSNNYYYDFGTGKQIERADVKEKRDALLGASNNRANQKKDDFLEGFNDPYGEKKEQERKERFANIRANADKRNWSLQKDPFLDGFNGTSNEENKWASDLFKEKTPGILNPFFPNEANRSLNELQIASRGAQLESKLNPPIQEVNSTPSMTHAVNRKPNAKNEFEHAIGDPNKEPVMVQYSNKPLSGRSNKDFWSYKNDEQGISILSHWLFGGGKDYIQEDGVWGDYMKSNEALTLQVKNIVLPLADDLGLNESKEVDITMPMKIDTGESIIGYQYLHGTNADVGGFQIKGTVYKDEKGDITYDLTYTWNDIIDPEYYYDTDAEKVEFAKSIPFANPKDYIIRISWHDKTKIRANPGLFNWNSGWLK